jgi:hypothetical protein
MLSVVPTHGWTRWAVVYALCAAGCALDASGLADAVGLADGGVADALDPSDGGPFDSSLVDAVGLQDGLVTDDASPDDVRLEDGLAGDGLPVPTDASGSPDATGPCDTSACGTPPASVKVRVALVDRTNPCPPGWKSTDVVEATPGDGCQCTCALTTSPTCPSSGGLSTAFGTMGCGSTGATLYPVASGGCTNFVGSGTLAAYFKGNPPSPLGGSCTGTTIPDKSAVARPRRLCEPLPGACAGSVCGAPFTECIEAVGACPASYPSSRRIGTGATLTCPTCSCSATATCSGVLTVYDGESCGGTAQKLTVDGTCGAASPQGVASYRYVTTATVPGCKPSYASVPGTRSLVEPRSLCCR